MNSFNALDVFPTRFFEMKLDQVDAFNVLNEILRKEDEIRMISSTRQEQSSDCYATDFSSYKDDIRIDLKSMDLVFELIRKNFEENNCTISFRKYWTAIYSKTAHHSTHNHYFGILDRFNYSGILYLTDIGGTNFFSTNPSSLETDFHSHSRMGKILIFPSALPHSVEPMMNDAKRVIVSFNCEIRENE